ncbi:hypothetical protein [Nitrosococcus wardiae]|uniref:Uncharacterized protein n=1 Tax=Nitrosococcus wardiae TaxID=1814290 RepID=A0A4P7BWV0_9GAMM|nr:hypothetical protein [Nitrosococcus wardiae]QBQ54441.1 hypothetical protein E3U44_07920 [Nitrosococcus wardiae]
MNESKIPMPAPKTLWFIAAILFALAIGLTPDMLIDLGPMRRSLTSSNPMTRNTAETTILITRLLCALGGGVLIGVIARWRRIRENRLFQAIRHHELPHGLAARLQQLSNSSLYMSCTAVLTGLLYVAVGENLLSSDLIYLINGEDGIIEYGTALLFLAAAIVAIRTAVLKRSNAIRHAGARRMIMRRSAVWHALLGLFFLLCVGEEVSWGQRLLGFETVDLLEDLNVQDENNLHNLLGYFADHLFIAGVFVYGALFPLLGHYFPFLWKAMDWLGLPVASLGLAVGFMIVLMLHDWTVYQILPQSSLRIAELRELLTSLCFLLLVVETSRRNG